MFVEMITAIQQDGAPCHADKGNDKTSRTDTWPLSLPDLNLLHYIVWARIGGGGL